jgi:hypothetical protein
VVKPATVDRIYTLSKQGKTANQIQRQLKAEGIGIRRTTLLTYVREAKGRKPRPHPEKHIPRKYRRPITPPPIKRRYDKHVAIFGRHNGVSKRIEISGTGKYLQQVLYDIVHHPPKKHILRTNQDEFERSRDLSRGDWDARPTITS